MAEKIHTKSEFINYVSIQTGQGNAHTGRMVDEIFRAIVTLVGEKHDEINITGFGKFSAQPTSARTGRNPQSGESLNIPASWRVSFSPGKAFKDAVKGR